MLADFVRHEWSAEERALLLFFDAWTNGTTDALSTETLELALKARENPNTGRWRPAQASE